MGTVGLLHKQEPLSSLSPTYEGAPTCSDDDARKSHELCLSPRCPPDGAAFFEMSPPNSSASSSPVTRSPTVSNCCAELVTHFTAASSTTASPHNGTNSIVDGGCLQTFSSTSSQSPPDLKSGKVDKLLELRPPKRASRPTTLVSPKSLDSCALVARLSVTDSPLPSPPPVTTASNPCTTASAVASDTSIAHHPEQELTPSSPPLPPPPPSPLKPPAIPSRDPQKQSAKVHTTSTYPSPVVLLQTQPINIKAPRPVRETNLPVTIDSLEAMRDTQPMSPQSPVLSANQIFLPSGADSSILARSPIKACQDMPPTHYLHEYQRQTSLPGTTLDPFCVQDGRTVIPWGPRSSRSEDHPHPDEIVLQQWKGADDVDVIGGNSSEPCTKSVLDVSRQKESKVLVNTKSAARNCTTVNSPTTCSTKSCLTSGRRHGVTSSNQEEHSLPFNRSTVGYIIDQPVTISNGPQWLTNSSHAIRSLHQDSHLTGLTSTQFSGESDWTRAQRRSERMAHNGDAHAFNVQQSLSTEQNIPNPSTTALIQVSPVHHGPVWQTTKSSDLKSPTQKPDIHRNRTANSDSSMLMLSSGDFISVDKTSSSRTSKPGCKSGADWLPQRMAIGDGNVRYFKGAPRRTSASLCDAAHQQSTAAASGHLQSPPFDMSQSVVLLSPGQPVPMATKTPSTLPIAAGWMTADPEHERLMYLPTDRHQPCLSRSHSQRSAVPACVQQHQHKSLPIDNGCYYQRSVSHTVPLEVYQPSDGGEAVWPPVLVQWHHRRRQATRGHQRQPDSRHRATGALNKSAQPHHHSASAICERLETQPWFHFNMSRSGAERLLKATPVGSFLVRQSETNKTEYSLSIKRDNDVLHMKISHDRMSGQYILGEYSQPYPSVSVMIYRYMHSLLPIRGTAPVLLRYPVYRQSNCPT